jgi:hypothetical protein
MPRAVPLFRNERLLVAGALLALVLALGAAPKSWASAAPIVTFACTPAPADCTGWYRSNVTVRWSVDLSAIKTVGCNTDTISTDTQGKLESCYAENVDGQSTRVDIKIRLDRTRPTVTGAVPDRPADANGWYNHPLSIRFQGTDPTSGVAACSTSTYAGPASAAASVSGTCRDNAGNTSPPAAYTFKYDATPPAVRASSSALNRAVVVRWTLSRNTKRVLIHRARVSGKRTPPELGRRVYVGLGKAFRDGRLRNGVTYVYTVVAVSQAGLASSAKVAATPTPLFNPPRGARVHKPPLLRWARVPRATYYNVQLRRDGKKILSTWPRRSEVQLHWRWRFAGRRYRLSAGGYRWYVWPGFGAQAAVDYGPLLGGSSFTVRR